MARKYYGETAKPDREFSSTQVDLPPSAAAKVKAIGRKISDSDLADDGREDQPHITVKFGLHDAKLSRTLKDVLAGFGPVSASLGETSLFQNDEFDVVKISVDSPDLHRLNKLIARTVKCTDTHPTYTPHATVAYVKKGRGKKYAGDGAAKGIRLSFDSVVFSAKDRSHHNVPLTGARASQYR